MTITDVMQAGLPFVVAPVGPERVQSWASFAAQATTKEAFSVVSAAFSAFWMEDNASYEFHEAARWMGHGEIQFVVMWLDGVVSTLQAALERWQRAKAELIMNVQVMQSWADPWRVDAAAWVERLARLLAQVVEWIVWACQQMQWDLTSADLKATRVYLAGQQR